MKTNYIHKTIIALALIAGLTSCTKFEELAKDPNKANNVPPSMLLSEVLREMSETPWNRAQRDNQFWVISFDYYGNQDYRWGETNYKYTTLANVIAMEKEAQKLDSKNKYEALANFFKAYFYDFMSKRVGDIPLSESLKAKANPPITTPKYDSQKEVYLAILSYLEKANKQIDIAIKEVGTAGVDGDFFYKGNLTKWQKAINAFHLRVLIGLSKRASDIDVANRVNTIISNPSKYPLMSNNQDNMLRVFSDENGNNYRFNPGNYGFNRNRNILGATYLNLLKQNNDPRIYKVADPAKTLFDENNPLSLTAYIGANTGDEQGPMQVASDEGKLSYPNEKRYYSTYKGEPYIQIGYIEQEFNVAEAINRGWVSGNAETHYKNGIKASMEFYGVDATKISEFLANTNIVYKGNNAAGLKQILTQKYIGFFNNSGREAYFNYRRTGIPTFHVGPANKNGSKIPNRWKYPQSEFQDNKNNVNASLNSQYGGADDINNKMWLIK